MGAGERAECHRLATKIRVGCMVCRQCFPTFGYQNPAEDHPKGF